MKSEEYKDGMLHGYLKTYYEDGGIFEEVKYDFGTPKTLIIYHEDGSIADKKGFLNKKIIDSIIG
jgi:antitoxin component YwqK of YwqJK toxin-antitoxin module